MLEKWILPAFERPGRPSLTLGDVSIGQITEAMVREWHTANKERKHEARLAKAYRVLGEVMRAAAGQSENCRQKLIPASPVNIRGAGSEVAPEIMVLTTDQLVALAAEIDPELRTFVLLSCLGALRFGEALGLQRRDVDPAKGGVMLRREISQPDAGEPFIAPLKGRREGETRWIDLPEQMLEVLQAHLGEFVDDAPTAWLFTKDGFMSRKTFARKFERALRAAGIKEHITPHGLRHTGATWFAEQGATVREVMERLGHRTERTAMRYQHAARERMKSLAGGLGNRLTPAAAAEGVAATADAPQSVAEPAE